VKERLRIVFRMIVGPATIGLLMVSAAFSQELPNQRQTKGCTNASLKGDFGFTARGVTLVGSPVPAPLQGPFASAGTATFDGKGNFTLNSASSFNGIIQPTPAKGTYSVNRDCTYTSTSETGITFRAVIVNDGREIFILQTTPGVAISGIAQSQARSLPGFEDLLAIGKPLRCNNALVNATYGFIAEGAAGPPTLPPDMAGPLTGVGTVAFNSNGTFQLTATRSVNGVIDPAPLVLNGTYSVNPDCTFKMNFDVGFTFSAVIVNGGREILFLETDLGTTLLVKASRI
jgi:hypothetical protein